MGRLMVNLTDPNSYPPGGRTWAVAFVGTAGDLPLLTADGGGLIPDPSPFSRTVDADHGYNNYANEETIAYWPTDWATISVWEAQRCVFLTPDSRGNCMPLRSYYCPEFSGGQPMYQYFHWHVFSSARLVSHVISIRCIVEGYTTRTFSLYTLPVILQRRVD